MIVLVMTCFCPDASAQGDKYFTSNNKKVRIETFDNEVITAMKDIGIPGASIAIIDDGKIAYYNAYGIKGNVERDRIDKRTIFEGCSLSKSLLAFVAYQLVDEGKLNLDKPMHEYFAYEPLEHDPRYKLITSRMVLSHSSGIENHRDQNSEQLDIVTDPGSQYVYSGEGYVYLSKVIETILGQSYEQYVNARVIDNLKLKNTSLKFTEKKGLHKEHPSNYALGHNIFGTQRGKWKNLNVAPKGGNSFTAEDYAKLVLAIFDPGHLKHRRRYVLDPVIRIEKSSLFYGPGFEVYLNESDTIISHGGSNGGFKGFVIYSVSKKSGFVLLANHDLGKLMVENVCARTVGIDMKPFKDAHFELLEQYPSNTLSMFKVYRERGEAGMFTEMETLKKENGIGVNTLAVLGDFFLSVDSLSLSRRILEESVRLYPESSVSFALLGDVHWATGQGGLAYENYKHAKSLNFDLWDIEPNLKECAEWVSELERRKDFYTQVNQGAETTIEAENYNVWKSVNIEPSSDEGGGEKVGQMDSNSRIEYKIKVDQEGTYAMAIRIASLEESQLAILVGDNEQTKIDIPLTNGWDKWASVTAKINLPKGTDTLKFYGKKGYFSINWFKLSPAPQNEFTNK